MALCLAESLAERQGFDARDQMERYVRWWREVHWSSTGRCFDIGVTTRRRCRGSWRQASRSRARPIRTRLATDRLCAWLLCPGVCRWPERAMDLSGRELAHYTRGADVRGRLPLLRGAARRGATGVRRRVVGVTLQSGGRLLGGTPFGPTHRRGSGRIVQAQGTSRDRRERVGGAVARGCALRLRVSTSSFEEGALSAVNLGDDADTTGAIYGQIAGALLRCRRYSRAMARPNRTASCHRRVRGRTRRAGSLTWLSGRCLRSEGRRGLVIAWLRFGGAAIAQRLVRGTAYHAAYTLPVEMGARGGRSHVESRP